MPAKNKKTTLSKIIRYIIFATNIIVIVLLASSSLAWRVSPLKTNLFSYIGLGFGILLLLNIAYLLLWVIFSKWKLAFISLIALLVCYKPILTFFPLHLFPKEAPPNSIKILTYNVEGFRNEAHKNAFTHPVLEYIADTDADIVCLQEYMISKTGQSLISQHDVNKILHKYPYRSVTGLESSGKYHIYGLACFSKFPIAKTHEIIFDKSYNGAAVYTVNIGNLPYTVVNVHLESNHITAEDKKLYSDFIQNKENVNFDEVTTNIRSRLGRAYRKRVHQVQKINNYLAQEKTEGVIICGDFNDTPISYAYHQLKGNLNDAYTSTGFGPGITYHEDFFLFRIDYILHSKNMKAYRTKVDRIPYSDHYPVYTYLENQTNNFPVR